MVVRRTEARCEERKRIEERKGTNIGSSDETRARRIEEGRGEESVGEK